MITVESIPDGGRVCEIHLVEKRYCTEVDHTGLEPCSEHPERLLGAPIGQYHCPDCGCMVLAGMGHVAHDYGCLLGLEVQPFLDEMWAAMSAAPPMEWPDPDVFDE